MRFPRGIVGHTGHARNTPACSGLSIVSAHSLVEAGMDVSIACDRGQHRMTLTVIIDREPWTTCAVKRGGLCLLPPVAGADFGDYNEQSPSQLSAELRQNGRRVGMRSHADIRLTNYFVFRVSALGVSTRTILTMGLPDPEAAAQLMRRMGGCLGG